MKKLLCLCLTLGLLMGALCACGEGPPGKSAYELAVENGFQGTLSEWLASLKGEDANVSISEDGYWVINGQKTNVKADGSIPDATVTEGYAKTYPYTDESGAVHIRYQDTYTVEQDILGLGNVTITSYVTGTTQKDEELLSVDGRKLFATGCGSATVFLSDGSTLELVVEPSAINMLFVTGQSNASGDHATATPSVGYNQYVRTPDTMSYFTYTYQTLNITGDKQIANPNNGGALATANQPEDYVTPTLKWGTNTRYSSTVAGPHISVFDESSQVTTFTQAGWCAGLANEWVAGTGERVWVVNASHGGHPINNFIPARMGGPELLYNDYEQAVAVFQLALKTLYNEVDAGHFTLSHMAYYWFQGESDSSSDDQYYDEQFAKVHRGMMEDVLYDHGGEQHPLEFCGLMTLRSCKANTTNTTAELYMTGPRISQYAMGGSTSGIFSNVYVISNVTEKWVGGDANVEQYFLDTYGSAEAFYARFGYDMPTTMEEVHPQIHYFIQGQNEMGLDAGRNSLLLLNRLNPGKQYALSYTEGEMQVRLVAQDGVTEIQDGGTVVVDIARRYGYLIPLVEPVSYLQQGVTLRSGTPGISFSGYRLVLTGDAMPTSANVRVLVGGEVVKEYTLHLQYGSTLLSSQRRQHNLYGGDYNPPREIVYDEEANAVWQAGYLQYASGAFTAFNYVDSYGWLHFENEALWNGANWHGAFRDGTYSIGLSSAPGESMGFLYTASSSGTLTVQIEDLIDSKKTTAPDTIEMAVFVNGKIAWPAGATATDSGYTGWYRIDSTTTRKGLNEALTDLRISAIAGDEIAVVFERAMDGGTSLTKADQTMIYSAVYFTTEEANYTPNHDGSRTFSGESGAWSLGYLEYASRSFSAFTATAGGNWLCAEADVANIWSGTTHGAFWRAKSYAIAPGKRTDGATGMAFTAPVNGTYALKLDSLPVNQNTMSGKLYLAVFVNGSLRPFSGDSMAQDDTSTWYLIDPATSTLEGINAKLATLSLELKAGDQLVLAFARAGDAGQTSVVPTISWTAAQ